MRAGPQFVRCSVCGRRKCPVGRDAGAAAAASFCDWDCEGYRKDPLPSDLWPGEES